MESFILLANSELADFNVGEEIGVDKRYTLNFGNSIACSYFSCCLALILAMIDKNTHLQTSKKTVDKLYESYNNINAVLSTKEILLNGTI